jgi:methenyltetrahydrofolate cyclohydrolase
LTEPAQGAGPSYADERVRDFVALVASRKAAPAGGSVVAVATSLAAGLVAMAARHAEGRLTDADRLVEQADRWAAEALDLAEQDAVVYEQVPPARARLRSARSSGGDVDAARVWLRTVMLAATELPVRIAEVAADVGVAAGVLAAGGKPALREDAAGAAMLAAASARVSHRLVRENIAVLDEPGEEGVDLLRRASTAGERAANVVDSLPADGQGRG